MNNYRKRFIGSEQIKDIQPSNIKTYKGNEVYLLTYKSGKTELLPKKVIEQAATKKVGDLTSLQALRGIPVVAEILGVLAEADIKFVDANFIVDKVVESINTNQNRAVAKLWGEEYQDRTFMQAERILKPKKDEATS